jgi:hypothetical protein
VVQRAKCKTSLTIQQDPTRPDPNYPEPEPEPEPEPDPNPKKKPARMGRQMVRENVKKPGPERRA